jgi:flagellar hook-length control protein FliK
LASSAVNTISSSTAAAHAHGAKAQDKSTSGDKFADMLAAADDAAPHAHAAHAKHTAKNQAPQKTEKTGDQTDDAQDIADDAADAAQAATAQAPSGKDAKADDARTADTKDAAKTGDAKTDDVKTAANDNAAAFLMVAAPQQPASATPAGQAAQDTDADESAAVAGAEAAAATQASDKTAPKPAPAKAAKPNDDFKKALDATKSANADSATAAAANADADADANRDIKQADAAPKDVQAPATAPTHTGTAQPDALALSAPAPAPSAANTPAAAAAAHGLPAAAGQAPNLHSLAVEIATRSQSGSKQFDIRLDPPELGRVDVRLSIDATGKAQAHLTADQPQTLDLLQKDAPALTRALRDAGLDVNQDGLNFSLRNQQQQAGQDHQPQGGRATRVSFAAPVPIESASAAGAYGSPGLGLLDIKV